VPTDAKLIASRTRYGVQTAATLATATTSRTQGWHTVTDADPTSRFARWNVSASGASAAADFRNEPQTFGYNVEIDPANVASVPAKRMAMGRFAHEAAVCGIPVVASPWLFTWAAILATNTSTNLSALKTGTQPTLAAVLQQATNTSMRASCTLPSSTPPAQGEWLELSINNAAIKAASFGFSQPKPRCWCTRGLPLTPWAPPKWTGQSGAQSTTTMARSTLH
jgi:uncharacterized protein